MRACRCDSDTCRERQVARTSLKTGPTGRAKGDHQSVSNCPDCQHQWVLHAGSSPWLVAGCAECIAEEDEGRRTNVCGHLAPQEEQPPAARRLHGRLQQRRFRHDRILIEDEHWYRWAELPATDGLDLRALLADIDADLAALPPIQFARKYRQWMSPRSFGAAIADRAG